MLNCFPMLLQQLLAKKLPPAEAFPVLSRYAAADPALLIQPEPARREETLAATVQPLREHYGVVRRDAEELVLRLCLGGGEAAAAAWVQETRKGRCAVDSARVRDGAGHGAMHTSERPLNHHEDTRQLWLEVRRGTQLLLYSAQQAGFAEESTLTMRVNAPMEQYVDLLLHDTQDRIFRAMESFFQQPEIGYSTGLLGRDGLLLHRSGSGGDSAGGVHGIPLETLRGCEEHVWNDVGFKIWLYEDGEERAGVTQGETH